MQHKEPDVLQNVALFDLNITLWSGRVKLYAEDLRNTGLGHMLDDMPEEVVNLGSKRIFPQECLRPFNSHKYHAEKVLLQKGFRSYSSCVVPREAVDDIRAELEKIRARFYEDREELKAGYKDRLYAWADAYPEWRDAILGAAPTADTIYAKLQFGYRYFLLAGQESVGESGDDNVTGSLIDELLNEVKAEADRFWHEVLKGRDRVPRRSLCRLAQMAEKLHGFSFIDSRVPPMAMLLESALQSVPPEGAITGHSYHQINSAVLMLSDPEREKAYGQAVIDGPPIEDEEIAAEAAETDVSESASTAELVEQPVNDESTHGSEGATQSMQALFAF